jgi:patatin-like phospholipase/acyl hydrolase
MQKPKFKILSIDGGGIRGVIPCRILSFIESQLGGSLSSVFNLISGTSTGGIISLGLSTPSEDGENAFDAQAMLELYRKNGETIFGKRQQDIWTKLASFTPLKDIIQKPYDEKFIEGILQNYFKDIKLKQVLTNVLVTTHDIHSNRPFYFSSRLAKKDEKENFPLRTIARATSAAPTYFEPVLANYKENEDLAFIDGGVFANNPSILAYCEAKEIWKRKAEKAFEADVLPDDNDLPFYMLSLSTGLIKKSISGKDAKNFGTVQWLNPLLSDIFMQSVSESTHYTMQHLLPFYTDGTPRYQRLEMEIPEANSKMDDASKENIEQLIALADNYIKENKKTLLEICEILS